VKTDFKLRHYRRSEIVDRHKAIRLNPNVFATSNAPPTFLLQAQNDPVDDVRNSMTYSLALRNAKVPVEPHLYAEGGHGFGLRRTKSPITGWPQLVETWLRTIGMIPVRHAIL
jgi:acetyl esterase/lipase